MPDPGPKLIIVEGEHAGTEFPLREGENRIGRITDNDIVLKDRSVSRQHAVILVNKGACVIEDRNSQNGIEVNGTRVQQCQLTHGLRFRLGDFTLVFMGRPEAGAGPDSQKAMVRSPSVRQAPGAGDWQELFGPKAEKPQEDLQTEPLSTAEAEEIDLFADQGPAETGTLSRPEPQSGRLGLMLYILLVVVVLVVGLFYYQKQTRELALPSAEDYVLRKGEKRVFILGDVFDEVQIEDDSVVRAEPIRYVKSNEQEPQIFLLVEAIGPGTTWLRFRPAQPPLRVIVQGKQDRGAIDVTDRPLTPEQRLQMGKHLLRSGQLKQESNLAAAMEDFSRAAAVLRPIRKEEPLHAEAMRQSRRCKDRVFRKVRDLKEEYYSANKAKDDGRANLALIQILRLLPDPSDPQHQLTRLILQLRQQRNQ